MCPSPHGRALIGVSDSAWRCDKLTVQIKAAPTTMVKDRGWGLTITTRGVLRNGYTNVSAKPALRQPFGSALHTNCSTGSAHNTVLRSGNSHLGRCLSRSPSPRANRAGNGDGQQEPSSMSESNAIVRNLTIPFNRRSLVLPQQSLFKTHAQNGGPINDRWLRSSTNGWADT